MDGDSLDERKSLSFAMSVVAVGNVNVIFVTLCNVHHNFACCKTHSRVSDTYVTNSARNNRTLPKIETSPERKQMFLQANLSDL